jgi:single-stranded DNA-binding protein
MPGCCPTDDGGPGSASRLPAGSSTPTPDGGATATYLAVVAWRGLGELAARLRTGDRVVVIGHLRQYDYARDDAREIGYEVQAQEIAVGLSARSAATSHATAPTVATGAPPTVVSSSTGGPPAAH